jgi:hypothetical protein
MGRDRVGRSFPSVLFAAGNGRPEPALLPGVFGPFFGGAAEVLSRGDGLDAVALAQSINGLRLPGELELGHAQEEHRRKLAAAHDGRLQQLFDTHGVAGSQFYALRTFLSACDAERRSEPGRLGLALDCPLSISPEVGPALWLELLTRRLPRWTALTLLWSSQRLLLGFGALSGPWLAFLARTDHPSMKRWPLATQLTSAVEAAKSSLTPGARAALERRDLPLGELLGALATA